MIYALYIIQANLAVVVNWAVGIDFAIYASRNTYNIYQIAADLNIFRFM